MEQEMQTARMIAGLQNVFNYAFIETASYHFVVPKKNDYTAINIIEKTYLCDSCGKSYPVKLKQNGLVYINNKRLAEQQKIYRLAGISFPDVVRGDAFAYRQHGFCCDCAMDKMQADSAQRIYTQCVKLMNLDETITKNAQEKLSLTVEDFIASISSAEDLKDVDLTDYPSIYHFISSALVRELDLTDLLQEYLAASASSIREINALLDDLGCAVFQAYVARPMTIYETLDDEIYNEYTVIFPAEGTGAQEFFSLMDIKSVRVQLFLQQKRIRSVSDLLGELVFEDSWATRLVDRARQLNI